MIIVFVMKDRTILEMECEEFSISKTARGELEGFIAKNVTNNRPIYFPVKNISYIYQKNEEARGKNDT